MDTTFKSTLEALLRRYRLLLLSRQCYRKAIARDYCARTKELFRHSIATDHRQLRNIFKRLLDEAYRTGYTQGRLDQIDGRPINFSRNR